MKRSRLKSIDNRSKDNRDIERYRQQRNLVVNINKKAKNL